MSRMNSKSGAAPRLRQLAVASSVLRTDPSAVCSSRMILRAGYCMVCLPFARRRARRSAPLPGGRSVQCARDGERELVAAPVAPAGQVPGEQFAFAADGEAVIGALAIRLHGLFADRQVECYADGGHAIQNARGDLGLAPG